MLCKEGPDLSDVVQCKPAKFLFLFDSKEKSMLLTSVELKYISIFAEYINLKH